jgi:sarcosine oxidase
MAQTTFDVIVLGVGVMGASACWSLAKQGVSVLGIDQYNIPNTLGSSHGHTRMTRSDYFEHPDYVPLIKRANELWRELEHETGADILNLSGAIYIGLPDSELIAGSRRAADLHSLKYKLLVRDDLAKQCPQFNIHDDQIGLWERDAGYLYAEQAVTTLASSALNCGAVLHGCEQALNWSPTHDGVIVKTDAAQYSAGKLIICGGPWSSDLVSNLGVELKVTRQAMGWVWPNRHELFTPDKALPFAVDDRAGSLHYGFPILPGAPGIKLASHAKGDTTNPDSINHNPTPADNDSIRKFTDSFLTHGCGPTLAIRICMYTNSPDSNFIVSSLPGYDNVSIGCGFSGHGFKFAPVIGEELSNLALNIKSQIQIEFLSIDRFL